MFIGRKPPEARREEHFLLPNSTEYGNQATGHYGLPYLSFRETRDKKPANESWRAFLFALERLLPLHNMEYV
jgi:hypothetical protein